VFFHAATTTFETPCSWVFTKEDGSSGSCFAKLCCRWEETSNRN
jgi:hypothetical protein